jgi:hypothetical protein
MAKSLIRKNQLHPDIIDLVSGYGTGFFVTPDQLNNAIDVSQQIITQGAVLVSGNQNISGLKNFVVRPTVNGSGVLLQGEASLGAEFKFTGDLTVVLSNGKTFGKYQNGQTIPASGRTTSEVIKLAIVEAINPTVNLSVSPTNILLGQTNISNQLTFSRVINNPGATVASVSLEFKRNNESTWNILSTNINLSSPFTHTFTNTSSNSNAINYRYIVTDSLGSTATGTANASFLHGNYFGYSSATSLTTIAQIEALGNQVLSDSRSRTVNGVTAGANLYTYYAYRAGAGDLTSIIQDGAAPILGAFTKQSDVAGTNLNGASVTYRVYRSNATEAFTNNTLAFS